MKSAITAGPFRENAAFALVYDFFHLLQVFQMRIDSSGPADHLESCSPWAMIVLVWCR